jgi:hypothetical protein
MKPIQKITIMAVSLLMALSSCSQDETSLEKFGKNDSKTNDTLTKKIAVASTCTNGFTVNGAYSNIGGSGGVDLTGAATTLTGPAAVQTLTTGKLYRLSKTTTSLSTTNSFSVSNSGAGDIFVRVVGISSDNAVLLVSAKKVSTNGNIDIKVCNTASFSVFSSIRFEIYAFNTCTVAWTF